MNKWLFSSFVLIAALVAPSRAIAQVVAVTLRLDTNVISVGGSTKLRVFAQVIPSVRANAERIFSWYVDVLNTNSPVELMAIPVSGLSTGQTRFQVRAGSRVPELSSDFLVAPLSGNGPLTGGDYSAANADLRVLSEACAIQLQIAPLTGIGGPGQRLLLSFTPCPGFNHTVEYRDALNDVAGWRALPAAPHNSGSVTVTNSTSQRFYRVNTTSP